jgi:hypothetical protein
MPNCFSHLLCKFVEFIFFEERLFFRAKVALKTGPNFETPDCIEVKFSLFFHFSFVLYSIFLLIVMSSLLVPSFPRSSLFHLRSTLSSKHVELFQPEMEQLKGVAPKRVACGSLF